MSVETCAFFSGHANSGAMVARLCKTGKSPDVVVHAETGLEFDEVLEWMDTFEKKLGIEIIRESVIKEKPHVEFFNFFNTPPVRGRFIGELRGMPMPEAGHCWHQANVKKPVFKKYENSFITLTGFTVEERHRILKRKPQRQKRYPLIEWQWTANDSKKYLKNLGMPHPMYEIYGFPRLGCCICPNQTESQLKIIYDNFPKIWDLILDLDDKSPHGFRGNWKASPYELMNQWEREKPSTTLCNFGIVVGDVKHEND